MWEYIGHGVHYTLCSTFSIAVGSYFLINFKFASCTWYVYILFAYIYLHICNLKNADNKSFEKRPTTIWKIHSAWLLLIVSSIIKIKNAKKIAIFLFNYYFVVCISNWAVSNIHTYSDVWPATDSILFSWPEVHKMVKLAIDGPPWIEFTNILCCLIYSLCVT